MFAGVTDYNQPLNSWDTSQCTDFSYMFQGTSMFNQPLDQWDTSRATKMDAMFADTPFNQVRNGSIYNREESFPFQLT
jgi:hypothetical protein